MLFMKNNRSPNSRPSSSPVLPLLIGRSSELHIFVHEILQPGVPLYNILSISGQGGIRKSTLLIHFIAEAVEQQEVKPMQEPYESASSDLMTIPQVSSYLGVYRARVYKLIAQGLLVIRRGRLVRIQKLSLQQWLNEQEQKRIPS